MSFEQDGTTAHSANNTIQLFKERYSGQITSRIDDFDWPPRSFI